MISRETREGREEGGEADVTQKCDKKAIVISAFRHSLTHSTDDDSDGSEIVIIVQVAFPSL